MGAPVITLKTMDDEFSNIPDDDKQDYSLCILGYWLKSFETTSFEPTNQNSIKVEKILSQRKR